MYNVIILKKNTVHECGMFSQNNVIVVVYEMFSITDSSIFNLRGNYLHDNCCECHKNRYKNNHAHWIEPHTRFWSTSNVEVIEDCATEGNVLTDCAVTSAYSMRALFRVSGC